MITMECTFVKSVKVMDTELPMPVEIAHLKA